MTSPTDKHREEAREIAAHRTERFDSFVSRIAASLSSRDQEIREVLEGLRTGDCWCPNGQLMEHSPACLAAYILYNKLLLVKGSSNVNS